MIQTAPIRFNPRSIALVVVFWAILQLGCLFTPGLLDDVDSVYIEIAREMLHRHDFVTPYIDGIRFFDKPPLIYWLAAGSMRLFGEHAWAARLPLALGTLALFLATYGLALRLFRQEKNPERAAFYSALALATSIGPFLFTRFYIPDILIALWMTLGILFFLTALDRVQNRAQEGAQDCERVRVPHDHKAGLIAKLFPPSALPPCSLFAATLALNLLTKGLIGLIFPIAFVLLYLVITRQLKLLPKLHPISSSIIFLLIALPWHVVAAIRNPAIPLPAGVGLPAKAGWAWFYLYNEHFARFLGKRIPHDYGQTPIWLFWLYAILWIFPWAIFLPAVLKSMPMRHARDGRVGWTGSALTLFLWPAIVLVFFTLSSRQEYYSLPALPALALIAGCILARSDSSSTDLRAPVIASLSHANGYTSSSVLRLHLCLLLPLASLISLVCLFFALNAPRHPAGTDLSTLLSSNPADYNVSLGHIFDLTGAAMGVFRGPLLATALGMAVLGPASFFLRRRNHSYAANLTLAAGMTTVLLAAHTGYVRFNPILGSEGLADAILDEEQLHPQPSLILLDGELTSGSSILFYTRQPVHLVNGRVNGPWFGSFWPDAPPIFESEATLRQLWKGPERIFLMTYNPAARTEQLQALSPVHTLATSGGKTILSNR